MPEAGTLAREYYDKAVTGDVEAQHALAKCYATADGGVGRDMSASFDWDLKAARNGNGDAMYAVGCRYAEGIEVWSRRITARLSAGGARPQKWAT